MTAPILLHAADPWPTALSAPDSPLPARSRSAHPRAASFTEFTIVPTVPRKTTSVSARSIAGHIISLFLFARRLRRS
jgi:hypothetical protein